MGLEIKQKAISWSELADIQAKFADIADEWIWESEEERILAELDYVSQYIDGNENPQISLR